MESTRSKGHYVGEIAVVLMVQFVLMLFRLVEPIQWPNLFPGQYRMLLNELVYFGIEIVLVIVIIAHFIFKRSFYELGIRKFKENIPALIGNLCIVVMSVGIAYLMSQFSKNVEVNILYTICQIITNFIAIAFLKELVFRGFLWNSLNQLTNGKGIIASIITAVCFSMTYVPSLLVSLDEVSTGAMLQGLILPFAMGLYLSLLYYYSKNLWMCTMIHGVLICLQCLEQDFIICTIEGIYIVGVIIYLIGKMVKYYKGNVEVEESETSVETLPDSLDEASILPREEVRNIDEQQRTEVIEPFRDEVATTNNEVVEEEIGQLPNKMLDELDKLHEQLKERVREKLPDEDEQMPDLSTMLGAPLDREITELEDRL